MKRIILILTAIITLASCSVDDGDYNSVYYEFLPVSEAEVPTEFTYGEEYEITISYTLPNSCSFFNNLYYDYQEDSRIVAVNSYVVDDSSCMEKTTDAEYTFTVHCLQRETYIFKFWQGEDADGNNQYLTIEVPVIN